MNVYSRALLAVALVALLPACVSDPNPRELWTGSKTLPVDVVAGVELNKPPTPEQEKQLLPSLEREVAKLLTSKGVEPLVERAIAAYAEKLTPERTRVVRDNVKIAYEDEQAPEPGFHELLYVFRLVHRLHTVETRAATARLRVVMGIGETTASPRDAIDFPATFRRIVMEEMIRIGTAEAKKLGLVDDPK